MNKGQTGPLTCFVNKVLLEQSHVHLFMYSLWLPSQAVVTMCPAKPTIFTIWPSQKILLSPDLATGTGDEDSEQPYLLPRDWLPPLWKLVDQLAFA